MSEPITIEFHPTAPEHELASWLSKRHAHEPGSAGRAIAVSLIRCMISLVRARKSRAK